MQAPAGENREDSDAVPKFRGTEMEIDGIERRRHPRERFISTFEYALISDADIHSFKCSTANISEGSSGFCIYSRGPLSGGQEIVVRKSDLPFRCKRARVLWAYRINERLYVAGLQCSANYKDIIAV